MTLLGHIENGVIVLDDATTLPDGMRVRVEVVPVGKTQAEEVEEPKTLHDRYQSVIGVIDDMPEDFAAQHDHYIHGTPKKDLSERQEPLDPSPTLYEQLQPIVGILGGLPSDFASDHGRGQSRAPTDSSPSSGKPSCNTPMSGAS